MGVSSSPGTRWRGGLVLFLSLCLAAAPACGSGEEEPVTVAKTFARAARQGNVDAMMPLLEDDVVAFLEASAEQASDQVGGRRRVEPNEMLRVVDMDPMVQIADAELLEQGEETAVVELTDTEGESHRLELVRQGGAWKVRLPLPPVEGAAPPDAAP